MLLTPFSNATVAVSAIAFQANLAIRPPKFCSELSAATANAGKYLRNANSSATNTISDARRRYTKAMDRLQASIALSDNGTAPSLQAKIDGYEIWVDALGSSFSQYHVQANHLDEDLRQLTEVKHQLCPRGVLATLRSREISTAHAKLRRIHFNLLSTEGARSCATDQLERLARRSLSCAEMFQLKFLPTDCDEEHVTTYLDALERNLCVASTSRKGYGYLQDFKDEWMPWELNIVAAWGRLD